MKQKPSAFGTWFKEQYGQLPSLQRTMKLRTAVNNMRSALFDAEADLRKQDQLNLAFNNALYGWNARKP